LAFLQRLLLRGGVAILSLVFGVVAGALVMRAAVPPFRDPETGFSEGTPIQLIAFLATLSAVGGMSFVFGLIYLERWFERRQHRGQL
jgi:hypothetical protein